MSEREGYRSPGLNTQDVAQLVEGKPEGTERFAIKQLGHKRGSGTLPRGLWTRDYTKDKRLAPPPLAKVS
jgi:hypothetical protein